MAHAGPSSACACRCSSTDCTRRTSTGASTWHLRRWRRSASRCCANRPDIAWLFVFLLFTAVPALAFWLLSGGFLGLDYVDTNLWGGLMLDVLISFVTVAGSLPLGILLALGRRSQLPVVRTLSVCYIELWRGVPLLTVLFMSAVMLPLFLPEGVSVDRLLRAMVALILFNAAYMAEVVRGGLQGVDTGQEEAGSVAGLTMAAHAGLHRAAAGAAHRAARDHQHRGRPVQGHHAGDDHRLVRSAGRGGAGAEGPGLAGICQARATCSPPWCSSCAASRCRRTDAAWSAGWRRGSSAHRFFWRTINDQRPNQGRKPCGPEASCVPRHCCCGRKRHVPISIRPCWPQRARKVRSSGTPA